MLQGSLANHVGDLSRLHHWWSTLEYAGSFEQVKAQVLQAIRRWYPQRSNCSLNLDGIEACIAIKNSEQTVVYQNCSYQHFFTGGQNGSELPKHWKTVQLAQKTDHLILDGMQSIECEHIERDPEGRQLTFRTAKTTLAELQDQRYFILGLSRPVAVRTSGENEKTKSLAELVKMFQSMDRVDQMICRLDAKGETTKDIAVAVGLTSRSIENRRNRMLALFGAQRPIELVRITIRLEEHDMLPA